MCWHLLGEHLCVAQVGLAGTKLRQAQAPGVLTETYKPDNPGSDQFARANRGFSTAPAGWIPGERPYSQDVSAERPEVSRRRVSLIWTKLLPADMPGGRCAEGCGASEETGGRTGTAAACAAAGSGTAVGDAGRSSGEQRRRPERTAGGRRHRRPGGKRVPMSGTRGGRAGNGAAIRDTRRPSRERCRCHEHSAAEQQAVPPSGTRATNRQCRRQERAAAEQRAVPPSGTRRPDRKPYRRQEHAAEREALPPSERPDRGAPSSVRGGGARRGRGVSGGRGGGPLRTRARRPGPAGLGRGRWPRSGSG